MSTPSDPHETTDPRDMIAVPCWRPDCGRVVVIQLDAQGPAYCSPACESTADKEYREALERVARLEELLRRSRHWLASFGRGDTPDPLRARAAHDAMLNAEGTLLGLKAIGGPSTDAERHVTEALARLLNAARPLIDQAYSDAMP